MNVVVVNDFSFVNGGASKIALGSSRALAGQGHQVTLFTGVGPIDPELQQIENLNVICLQQHEIVDDPNRLRAVVQGFWNRHAECEMRELLAKLNPGDTVVHIHVWTKCLSSSVVRAAIDLGFAVVLTLHDYFAACPTGTFYLHNRQTICQLRPMSAACICTNCDIRSYPQKLWRVGRQFIQQQFGLLPGEVLHYISISDLSEIVLKPHLSENATVHRVRNFIDVTKHQPADVASQHDLSFSGRLSLEKGPLLLAEAARTADLGIQFIGDGPLNSAIQKISPQSIITGWLPPAEAAARLRRSRCLIFPSLWYETQGLVVAEASAMGIPSIVPDTSAAREWVEDGVTGLWFKGGNATDLAAKIRHLQKDAQRAAEMGRAAFVKYWSEPSTISSHTLELENVYRAVLADKRSR